MSTNYPCVYPWKTAWIIGGSTGLGAEVTRQLDQCGVEVIVSARSLEALNSLVENCKHTTALPLDITQRPDIQQSMENVLSRFSTLPDLVVINAAIYTPMGLKDFDTAAISNMINVNYMGVVNVLEALLPFKNTGKKVTLAAVTSPSGWRGLPGGIGYAPTKAAVINLFEGLKPELDNTCFDLKIVNPGFIRTRLTAKNKFNMPQLMEPADAARKMLKGLTKNTFEIAFPNPFIFMLKVLRIVPYKVYFWAVKKIV